MRHIQHTKIAPDRERTVVATMPDGTVVTRTSKTMTYKWAIVRYDKSGIPNRHEWCVLGWSQTDETATKTAHRWAKYGHGGVGLIRAVEIPFCPKCDKRLVHVVLGKPAQLCTRCLVGGMG